jgi:mono/diheme cytochrome c family protein
MRRLRLALFVAVTTLVTLALAVGTYVRSTGLVARADPGRTEVRLARTVRSLAIPGDARDRTNPVAGTPAILAAGRAHYADHCAVCHGADGRGKTEMGQGLWPKTPDMRLDDTQGLSDGELFWIIENGIRFTGMPGWSTGTAEGEDATWHLVHFIRSLPRLGEAEIEEIGALMPRAPAEIRREIEAERFLAGENPPPAPADAPAHVH